MEVTPLQGHKSEVDSTTDIDSPVKKPKLIKSKPKAKPKAKQVKGTVAARTEAAQKRAAEIFSSTPSSNEDEVHCLRQQVQDLERKLASPPQVQPSSKLLRYMYMYSTHCL